MRDDAVGDQDAAISVLEQNMREYMEHYSLYDKLVNAYEHAEEDRKLAIKTSDLQSKWITIIGTIELWFLIFGTLQWGYGDRWIRILDEVGFYS